MKKRKRNVDGPTVGQRIVDRAMPDMIYVSCVTPTIDTARRRGFHVDVTTRKAVMARAFDRALLTAAKRCIEAHRLAMRRRGGSK